MTHLTSDELIDAMEGLLAPERQAHLDTCSVCQRQLTELSGILGEARQVSVPEPSPLFWRHFSERVRGAIDAPSGSRWPSWLRWQVVAPLGALTLMVVALAINIRPAADDSSYIADDSALDAPLASDGWATLTVLVGEIDLETASAAGVIEPGAAEQAVLGLSSEEQQELTRLLKAELMRAKS
jgi:hypothetical protein